MPLAHRHRPADQSDRVRPLLIIGVTLAGVQQLIGINTVILLESCSYIVYEAAHGSAYVKPAKSELWGWVTLNASLLVFCVLLVVAGITKGSLVARAVPFDRTMAAIAPFMTLFAYSGIGIFAGLCLILAPLTRTLLQILATPDPEELSTLSS